MFLFCFPFAFLLWLVVELTPKDAIISCMLRVMEFPMVTMAITAAMPIMIPSIVSMVRSLLDCKLASARLVFSRSIFALSVPDDSAIH